MMTSRETNPKSSRQLYKNPDQAKLCGVCAGVAEYFGFEVWVVRIITVSLLLLGAFNGVILLVYFILCFVLDPKPGSKTTKGCFGRKKRKAVNENLKPETRPYRPSVKDVWKSGASPRDTLEQVEGKFSKIEGKLQRMESFVTSRQFELQREFNKMEA